jgi:hypothetical protein
MCAQADRAGKKRNRSIRMKPLIAAIALLASGAAQAQSLMEGETSGEPVRLLPSDAAVLDLQQSRDDLACSVTALKPHLGFDFFFRTGYQVRIGLKELAGPNNLLTIVMRVSSEKRKDQPTFFVQRFRVPAIDESSTGSTVLDGSFRLGEGKYHVDWLMRDAGERVCARFWDAEATPTGRDSSLAGGLPQDSIQPVESALFQQEGPVERQELGRLLRVKVIVNFAPQSVGAPSLGSDELQGLAAIVRQIAREPRIGSFSIVAGSVRAQQVIYRQQNTPRIDLPSLGEAIKSLNFAEVDAKILALKHGETDFLTRLIAEEAREDHLDGLIFVGPKYSLDGNVSSKIIDQLKDCEYPVFYLNYSVDPNSYPWRDSIGRVVKQLNGFEYTISRPRDLFNAWSDIVSHLLSAKLAAGSARAQQ